MHSLENAVNSFHSRRGVPVVCRLDFLQVTRAERQVRGTAGLPGGHLPIPEPPDGRARRCLFEESADEAGRTGMALRSSSSSLRTEKPETRPVIVIATPV
ncbi:MAG: hypothetical protein C4289_02145 [Chloroflexota bacterium]